MSKSLNQGAPAAEEMLSYAAANSSVFRCVLKVVMQMVVQLCITGDREFQRAGAVMLNALD